MLEKRRFGTGCPAHPLLVVLITSTLCLSLWRFSSYPPPGAELVRVDAPSYVLLQHPGNVSNLPPPYPMHKLLPEDRTTLIDLQEFDYRINNFPCNDTDSLLLLVLIHTAPLNVEKRDTIRGTWGRTSPSHKLLFLLGEVDSEQEQSLIEDENHVYGDIVQGHFRDTYRNMTYKHAMALKWTAYFCPNARYLLKADDDVFVNLPTLVDFISQELSPWGARRLILCAPFPASTVKRSYRSKWRVSPREYPGRYYPTYCAGWAVIYSPDVVFLLYNEVQRSEYFWIDDVHITGTLAARVNLTQTALGSLVLGYKQVTSLIGSDGGAGGGEPQDGDDENASTTALFLFGTPNMSQTSIHKLWRVVQSRKHPYQGHTPPS